MTLELIDKHDDLEQLCSHLAEQEWVTLDTEFMRERTYYAQLCLLQLGTQDAIYCVDPLAIDDIRPLLEVLQRPSLLKVLHSARQDLEVLYDLTGEPLRPIFDTQIAAALCGEDTHIGYAKLVHGITGVTLAKSHTRANWAQRPLSPAMLEYAADDVRYLRQVFEQQRDCLAQQQRQTWVEQDCLALTDIELYRNPPELAYQRIKSGHKLPPQAQTVLQALAAWRESTAQRLDRPRNWIVRDGELMELARAQPQDIADLEALAVLAPKTQERRADEIIATIASARELPAQTLWPPRVAMSEQEKQWRDALLAELEMLAQDYGLQSTVIASKKDIKALALGQTPPNLQHGWRHTLTEELLVRARSKPTTAS